jgi:leucyl/phenylalanyl-tRNA--protein transferase
MNLTPEILLNAYRQGIFPMADHDGQIHWYDPHPRAIFPLETFHVPRSLRRTINKGGFEVRCDTAFREVMLACAAPTAGRKSTWIDGQIVEAYCELHRRGFAHSVETWMEGQLVGGLYGVTVGGLFAGESMFSRATDSSKIALVYLVERLRERGFVLLDTQYATPHLRRFGAIEIPRLVYKGRLARALRVAAQF